jgi:MFS family permease
LTASFLAAPQLIQSALHQPNDRQWMIYLPILAASIILMAPAIIVAEKIGRMKEVFIATITLLTLSLFALAIWGAYPVALVAALIGFFTAFNVMEAILPSLVTKIAPADAKGTATGVYSSSQFLGIFFGGTVGGIALGHGGPTGVLAAALIIALVWLAAAVGMRRPGRYSNYLARVSAVNRSEFDELAARLKASPGVIDAVIAADEGVAYLKIDRRCFDAAAIARIVDA